MAEIIFKTDAERPHLEPLPHREFRLIEDFSFGIVYSDDDVTVWFVIPQGFIWNGASIPRIAWSIVGAAPGYFLRASCIHDFAYGTGEVAREIADDIFHQVILLDGARRTQARAMWRAVRMFGGGHYKEAAE